MTTKVLLTGATGQLGQELRTSCPETIELICTSRLGGNGLQRLDLSDADACRDAVLKYRPDWVLNAGAYTSVDKAEQEPELVFAVNAEAPRAFSEVLLETGGRILQISTDFVFNGLQSYPYRPEQSRQPLGVYGASKAAGEEAVHKALAQEGRSTILRTSWVYGPVGQNFLLTMLRLHRERDQIRVVADQVGCPTSTKTLSKACWGVVEKSQNESSVSLLHWSDAGVASWYDFAVAIGELAFSYDLIRCPALVVPIPTSAYPTAAQRPSYSLLDCSMTRGYLDLPSIHWRNALQMVISSVDI